MPFGEGLQSAVMYRTGKPFHGCANVFVFFFLLIYAVSTTLLLAVEGAQASPSQREIKDAQKIVGRFLRNEAGTTWLSGLAKTKSAPLTTEDLMNAILQVTRPGGRVWKAASILSEALKAENLNGIRPDAIMGQNENWKNLIADIEKEDDIICLYRKNTEQTTKKAEDWKKFLKTVSPGYTVHLAIDTGLKYVICLKKIDVPEAMSTEILTPLGILSTTASSQFLQEVTSATPALYPITPGRLATIPPSALKIYTKNPNFKPEESDESCGDGELEKTEDIDDEDDVYDEDVHDDDNDDDDDDDDDDYGFDNSIEHEHAKKKSMRRMVADFNAELEDYPVKSGRGLQRPISSPIGQRNFNLKNPGWPSYSSSTASGPFISQSSKKGPECNRPIILVVQGGNVPLGYRPALPVRLPIQRSLIPPPLQSIPRIPIFLPKISSPPFNRFVPAYNFPQLMKLSNFGKPIRGYSTFNKGGPQPFLSRNTQFTYKIPRERTRVVKPTEKPIVQTIRSAFDSNFIETKSRGSQFVRQRPNITMPKYQIFNYFPRRVERLPIPNVRNTATPISRPSVMSQWQQIASSRNIVLPRARDLDQSNLIRYNSQSRLKQVESYLLPQMIIHRDNSRLRPRLPISKPIFTPIASRPIQRSIIQPLRPLIYSRPLTRESSNVNRGFPERLELLPIKNINRIDPRLNNPLRPVQNIPQISSASLNSRVNYPLVNNFVQTQQRQTMPNILTPMLLRSSIYNPPFFIPWDRFYPIRKNGSCTKNSRDGNQIQHYPVACPSPCDRPIKLQIVIQGKVQDPLKVSVLTDPGQRVEVVGSGNPIMPYGSRADTSGTLMRAESGEEEERKEPEVVEVKERMNDQEEEQEKNEEETFTIDSTSVKSEELANEENSTIAFETEKTSTDKEEMENNETKEIDERILHEMTIEPNSIGEVNSTMSTITNTTVIV